MLPAAFLFRSDRPSASWGKGIYSQIGFSIAFPAYIIGLAGFGIGAHSAHSLLPLSKLSTPHAKAGIAFFVLAYCVVPIVGAAVFSLETYKGDKSSTPPEKSLSDDYNHVLVPVPATLQRRRTLRHRLQRSISSFFSIGKDATETDQEDPGARSFQVVSRRRPPIGLERLAHAPESERKLGHSRNASRGSDIQLSHLQQSPQYPTTPSSIVPLRGVGGPVDEHQHQQQQNGGGGGQRLLRCAFSVMSQAVIMFGIVYLLVSISDHSVLFGLAIAWSGLYYVGLVVLAWIGRPSSESLLVTLVSVFRGGAVVQPAATRHGGRGGAGAVGEEAAQQQQVTTPRQRQSSLAHSSYFSGAPMSDDSHGGHYFTEEDVDDETVQSRAEQEMSQREVVVMTVPRRQLRVVN
jgi:hypothetical protein